MYGVVPAAGEGTRLRPLTEDKPKGMVEVAGEPLLAHVFETLRESGVDELIVVVGYRKARIIEHFGDTYRGLPITYVHQREPHGLGHAVLQAAPYVDGPFVVCNGDNVFEGDLAWALKQYEQADADAAVVVESVARETATDTGVVTVDADDNRVIDIIEKPADPPSTLATTGCYIATPELFDALGLLRPSARGEYELTDGIGVLIRAGADVLALRSKHRRVNVNEPSDIDRAEAILETSPEQTTARSLIDTRALPS